LLTLPVYRIKPFSPPLDRTFHSLPRNRAWSSQDDTTLDDVPDVFNPHLVFCWIFFLFQRRSILSSLLPPFFACLDGSCRNGRPHSSRSRWICGFDLFSVSYYSNPQVRTRPNCGQSSEYLPEGTFVSDRVSPFLPLFSFSYNPPQPPSGRPERRSSNPLHERGLSTRPSCEALFPKLPGLYPFLGNSAVDLPLSQSYLQLPHPNGKSKFALSCPGMACSLSRFFIS